MIRVGALRQHITQNQELGVGMYVTVGTDFWSCTNCSSFAKWSNPWLCSVQCLLNVFKFLKTISIHGCFKSFLFKMFSQQIIKTLTKLLWLIYTMYIYCLLIEYKATICCHSPKSFSIFRFLPSIFLFKF